MSCFFGVNRIVRNTKIKMTFSLNLYSLEVEFLSPNLSRALFLAMVSPVGSIRP